MKGAVLALFCAVALASAEINENGCPVNPYEDILLPHPDCDKYYQCVQGDLLERKCASTTVFNVETQECDWQENVECGDRNPVVSDSSEEADNDSNSNGDNGTGEDSGTGDDSDNNSNSSSSENEDGDNNNNGGSGNGNPSEAAEICAAEGSDGVLVAHENCNQFYKCSEGVPVALECPSTLLFNPNNDQCDWPENVKCEGRNTDSETNSNEDNASGDSGSADNDNENNESDGNDNDINSNGDDNGKEDDGTGEDSDSETEDSDNNNNGGSGNGNPSEAAKICAAEGSDGVLVAHENCNQFYKCSEGVPVALECQSTLLFNPANDQCDWPENVNCERKDTDSETDVNEDSGSEDNVNGDNDNVNSRVGGNDNPSKAPEICAAEGSDGVLVAHENCNQFYKCSESVPFAFECFSGLVFNPANDQCDWPENVDCGSRKTATSFNKHNLRFMRY